MDVVAQAGVAPLQGTRRAAPIRSLGIEVIPIAEPNRMCLLCTTWAVSSDNMGGPASRQTVHKYPTATAVFIND